MESIGSRIALYRNSRRWTQERLASVIGITQGLLSEIENDKVSPRWNTITEIAKRLEVPIMNLLPVAGNNIVPSQYNDQPYNPTVQNNTAQREQQLWEALQKTQEELWATNNKLIQLLEQKGE